MDIRQLMYFSAVARTGSFSRAADELCFTRQALSKAVAKLEGEMGRRLLVTDEHGARLTAEGAAFLDEITPLLEAYGHIERKYVAPAKTQTVQLAVSQGSFHPFPDDLIYGFLGQEPDVDIHIEELHSDGTLDMVARGDAEIGILGTHRRYAEDFESMVLAYPGYYVSVPRGHELATRDVLTLADLDGVSFVTLGERNHLHRFFIDQCKRAGVHPKILIATSDMAIFERFRTKGSALAFACAPKYTQPFDDVVYVRLDMVDADKFGTHVVKRRDAALSPAAQRLWRYLEDYRDAHSDLLDAWREPGREA